MAAQFVNLPQEMVVEATKSLKNSNRYGKPVLIQGRTVAASRHFATNHPFPGYVSSRTFFFSFFYKEKITFERSFLELPIIHFQFLTNIPEKVLLEARLSSFQEIMNCWILFCQFVVVLFFFLFFFPDWNLVFSNLNISTVIWPMSVRTHSTVPLLKP